MPDEQTPATAVASAAETDRELQAMNTVVAALKPLKDDERKRVLEYVLVRFGAVPLQATLSSVTSSVSIAPSTPSSIPSAPGGAIQDIRSLKEAKNPRSANEMAALVAYYVSELATASERKAEINKNDIERYFKSGGFKLTSKAGQTLVNARHAGYLDPGSDTGHYKLNPVGYNLVVHRLGADGGSGTNRRRNRSAKKSQRRGKR